MDVKQESASEIGTRLRTRSFQRSRQAEIIVMKTQKSSSVFAANRECVVNSILLPEVEDVGPSHDFALW
jgi:hypothetical protein